mmetsp:Transcript_77268/g.213739  ORF Transcript_77268/g.213739 Transcript_77268/m.213739 type:complete len:95 (+) Transcript_77268:459-743(+)
MSQIEQVLARPSSGERIRRIGVVAATCSSLAVTAQLASQSPTAVAPRWDCSAAGQGRRAGVRGWGSGSCAGAALGGLLKSNAAAVLKMQYAKKK